MLISLMDISKVWSIKMMDQECVVFFKLKEMITNLYAIKVQAFIYKLPKLKPWHLYITPACIIYSPSFVLKTKNSDTEITK